MTEPNQPTAQTDVPKTEVEVRRPNFFVRNARAAKARFPRATNVFTVIGVTAVVAGTAKVVSNVAKNKDNLANAVDHVEAAGSELSASMSTPDSES